MAASPLLKPLTLLLAISGFIQGLLWSIVSILGLLTHTGVLDIPLISLSQKPTHNQIIANTIKAIYFSDLDFQFSVYPNALAFFLCFYCALSIFWTGFSCLMIYFARYSEWIALKRSLIGYSGIVIGVTVLDLTLMSMLIEDYRKVYDLMLDKGMVQEITYMLLVIGMMFTLAARGYVLLLLNMVSVVYALMVYCTTRIEMENQPGFNRRDLYDVPIDAYKDYQRNRNFVEAVNEEPMGWYPKFGQPPQLQVPLRLLGTDPEQTKWNTIVYKPPPPRPRPKPQGKKGPPIPFPDYTPPESPTDLQSVIKPYSSYY